MTTSLYDTLDWVLARARAIARDSGQCTVSRLLGGDCSPGPHHVHHVRPVSEGGEPLALENLATVCASHHPAWEGLRRSLLHAMNRHVEKPPVCRHMHRSAEARAQCEARMARRQRERVAA
jgi:HNH endonuclease